MTSIITPYLDTLYFLLQKPIFWATTTAISAIVINILLYRLNKRTFKLLYEKPHIQINSISIEPRHSSSHGMIPDGTHIDMEIINPSSFKNLITKIQISFFPFIKTFRENSADLEIPHFSRLHVPQILESSPVDKYENKLIKIVLTDIKKQRIVKYLQIKKKI